MSEKVSLWALFGVAAIALALMASIGNSAVTGKATELWQPRAIPAQTPPLQDVMLVTADTSPEKVIVETDDTAFTALAERMEKVEKTTCYLINLQLDRDAGRLTHPELISTTCPRWLH